MGRVAIEPVLGIGQIASSKTSRAEFMIAAGPRLETVLKAKKCGNRYDSGGPTNFHGMEHSDAADRISQQFE